MSLSGGPVTLCFQHKIWHGGCLHSFTEMSLGARAYVGLIITTGLSMLVYGLIGCQPADPARFIAYLTIAVVASGLKIRLPAVSGTLSTNFLFILIGVVELSFGETLLIGWGASLVQSLWRPQVKTRPVQLAFNIATLTLAATLAYRTYHWPHAHEFQLEPPLMLMFAATAFFLSNTLMIAAVISLTEQKSVLSVWRDNYFWSFPYYLVGAAVAIVFRAASKSFGWQTTLLVVPAVYAIYRSYRLYLDRLEQEKKRAEDERNRGRDRGCKIRSDADLDNRQRRDRG